MVSEIENRITNFERILSTYQTFYGGANVSKPNSFDTRSVYLKSVHFIQYALSTLKSSKEIKDGLIPKDLLSRVTKLTKTNQLKNIRRLRFLSLLVLSKIAG